MLISHSGHFYHARIAVHKFFSVSLQRCHYRTFFNENDREIRSSVRKHFLCLVLPTCLRLRIFQFSQLNILFLIHDRRVCVTVNSSG